MDKLKEVFRLAGILGKKVRIGINSGSVRERRGLEVKKTEQSNADISALMVAEALKHCAVAEEAGCNSIVLSLKASTVRDTVRAYKLAADKCDYPFHVGVTAAGPPAESLVKSSIGIGSLLLDSIGDTIRVSMTGPPHQEVEAAQQILAALELRKPKGAEIISCPTCGRCTLDLPSIVKSVQEKLGNRGQGLQIAIMGCVVNGPGEASEADIGIAGGKDFGVLFKNGKKIRKINADMLADELVNEVIKITV